MKLKNKFIVAFASALIVYGAINYFFQYFYVIPSYTAMEKNLSVETINRCQSSIRFLCKDMDRLVLDYAVWDDAYNYIGGSYKNFPEVNLIKNTFTNNNIDYILIFDQDKKLIWGNSFNPRDKAGKQPALNSLVTTLHSTYGIMFTPKGASKRHAVSGLIKVENSIMAIASCSVFPSIEKGEANGTLMMARILNTPEMASLSRFVLQNFSISTMSDTDRLEVINRKITKTGILSIKPADNETLKVFSAYPDVNGNPAFTIRTFVSRELFSKSQKIVRITFIILLTSGLGLIAFIGIIVQMIIIKPISKITAYAKKIGADKDYSEDLIIRNKDEIGDMNREFNCMLKLIKVHEDGLESLVREKTKEVRQSRAEMVYRLAAAAEERDDNTGLHIKRVYAYAKLLCKLCNVPEGYDETIALGGILHDVGKIGIPDAILLKPGKLTPEEYEIIKSHTVLGGKILENGNSHLMETAYQIALHHHEHYDGTGYPDSLKGEDIPMPARIIAVIDVFDALISKRVYKKIWNKDQIFKFFKEEKGKRFDPHITDCFLSDFESFVKIKVRNDDI